MYLNVSKTAEYLDIDVSDVWRLIREKQVRYIIVDDEPLLNRDQFKFFIEQREKYMKELEEYLSTPLPEDVDIKDED